ncbi:MAG: translation initiation factor eIF-2B subunit alpha [Bathelium mastoideum]|nr:MAG: translation initiation factor eIF-2B subunit alpha [Bathelium mastoideum]
MAESGSLARPTSLPSTPSARSFDIVATYHSLLAHDPELTMPVAAIEALVLCLSSHPSTTISETLDLLHAATQSLKAHVPNPISLSAGTDLFQRYLVTQLHQSRPGSAGGARPSSSSSGGYLGLGGDFNAVRQHLLSNGRLFVERAKASRQRIASFGRHFIRDGSTVLTNGGSRVVGAVLRSAAEGDKGSGVAPVRFRVVYVMGGTPAGEEEVQETSDGVEMEGTRTVKALRTLGVPVATIPESAVAYALGKVDMMIVGAEGVVENGGIISRLGTYQMGMLAKAAGKPFYVVVESHKFVRLYPLSQYDLPIEQRVIEFKVGKDEKVEDEASGQPQGLAAAGEDEGVVMDPAESTIDSKAGKSSPLKANSPKDAVDFTPPDLISGIITESGVLTPSAVSEELIKIWF